MFVHLAQSTTSIPLINNHPPYRSSESTLALLNSCIATIIPHPTTPQQSSECLDKFAELKTGKKLTYVIYGLSEDKRSIIVLKTSEEKDFDTFVGELPEKECRWAVYDFEYTLPGGEGIRNKLCFIMW